MVDVDRTGPERERLERFGLELIDELPSAQPDGHVRVVVFADQLRNKRRDVVDRLLRLRDGLAIRPERERLWRAVIGVIRGNRIDQLLLQTEQVWCRFDDDTGQPQFLDRDVIIPLRFQLP